jgi:2-iminobutanoate/2-iminopropanoate deaminase
MRSLFFFLAVCVASASLTRRIVATTKAPAAIGPYSQGVLITNSVGESMLHIAGQIGMFPNGTLVDGIKAQTEQALNNVKEIVIEACNMQYPEPLEVAGTSNPLEKCISAGFAKIYQCEVLMADLKQYADLNEVYAKAFTKDFPARAAYQVAALPKDALTEIKCDAAM